MEINLSALLSALRSDEVTQAATNVVQAAVELTRSPEDYNKRLKAMLETDEAKAVRRAVSNKTDEDVERLRETAGALRETVKGAFESVVSTDETVKNETSTDETSQPPLNEGTVFDDDELDAQVHAALGRVSDVVRIHMSSRSGAIDPFAPIPASLDDTSAADAAEDEDEQIAVSPGTIVTNGRAVCRVTDDVRLTYLDGTDYGAPLDGNWKPVIVLEDTSCLCSVHVREQIDAQVAVIEPAHRFGQSYYVNDRRIIVAFPNTERPWAIVGKDARKSWDEVLELASDGERTTYRVTRGENLLASTNRSMRRGGRYAIKAFPGARRKWAVYGESRRMNGTEAAAALKGGQSDHPFGSARR